MTQALDGFLSCLVGANQFALRGNDVALVARGDDMRGGMLRHGGVDIQVHDLGGLLGGPRDLRTADRHVIVTGTPGQRLGLLVDRIVRARVSGANVIPLPAIVGGDAARWFDGLVTLEDSSCLVLEPGGLLSEGPKPSRSPRKPAGAKRPSAESEGLMLVFSSASVPPAAGDRFAIAASRVAAVAQSLPVVPLPGCEPHVAGLGSWRRSAAVVLDLAGQADHASASRRYLLLRCTGGDLVALAIHSDAVLRRASRDDAAAAMSGLPAYIRGVFHTGGEQVALIDVDRLAAGGEAATTPAKEQLAAALV